MVIDNGLKDTYVQRLVVVYSDVSKSYHRFQLGYVPAYYSWFLSEAMNTHSEYDAIIEEYNTNSDYRERLKVQVTGTILRNSHTFLTQLVTA